MRIVVTLEAEAERIKALIEHLFQHHPDAQVHVNPPAPPTLTVGKLHAASGTPTHAGSPGHPK